MGYFCLLKSKTYSEKVISATFQTNINLPSFGNDFVVKEMFLLTSAVVLIFSHDYDVLILSCLPAALLSGLYFHVCEVLISSSDLNVFVSVVDLQIFEMTFFAQREITVLQEKHCLSSAQQS